VRSVLASVLQDVVWLGAGGELMEVRMRLFGTMLSTVALACGLMLAAPAPSIAEDVAPVLTRPFIPLGLSTAPRTSVQFQAKRPGVSHGDECTAFIETGRPGGAAGVPYGNVYRTLAKARKDALNRCSLTTLAQDGWGPCRTWCVKVGSPAASKSGRL
jgi:hypothetical protein